MLGPYRDRVIIELAGNAADAAAAVGAPGRLLLRLTEVAGTPTLLAANTGAPLDAAGVAALSSLRASAKIDPATDISPTPPERPEIGRFGVGFAAVLAVCDEPTIGSRHAAVRFSAAETRTALAADGQPSGSQVPVLRLGFTDPTRPPDGYDTVVVLPLRDDVALATVRRLLAAVDDPLLLALPALAHVDIRDDLAGLPPRLVTALEASWITLRRSGIHHASDLAGRTSEERVRPGWQVTWAIPRAEPESIDLLTQLDPIDPRSAGGTPRLPEVVHAPTPCDEPLNWPALLIADFPLDPGRRHVQPGPATDRLVAEAADAYAELLQRLASDPAVSPARLLAQLPHGTPAGWLDAALRRELITRLPDTPCLREVFGDNPIRPRDAVVLAPPAGADPVVLAALAGVLGGLVAAPASQIGLLERIGVTRLDLADVVDAWPAPEPGHWADTYRRLRVLLNDPAGREALARLPVPVRAEFGQRIHVGARGLTIPAPTVPAATCDSLAAAGFAVPTADVLDDPETLGLLDRLGAPQVGAAGLLASSALGQIAARADDLDPEVALGLTVAVADLLQLDGPGPTLPWGGDLLVPDADGELVEAALLVLADSVAADLFDPDDVGSVDPELAARWPDWVWQRLGVAATGPVVRAVPDAALDELDLDGGEQWLESLGGEPRTEEVLVVRDLDLILPSVWEQAVRSLLADLVGRRAFDAVPVAGGPRQPSYLCWWLRDNLGLTGTRDPDSSAAILAGLPPAPEWTAALPAEIRCQLGIVESVEALDAAGWQRLLTPVEGRDRADVLALWRAMSQAGAPQEQISLPELWAVDADGALCISNRPVIVDDPRWLQRVDLGPRIILSADVALAWADALDVDLSSERDRGQVTSVGSPQAVPDVVTQRFPSLGWQWWRHDPLRVDEQPTRWWVDDDERLHAVDLDSLAEALAFRLREWPARHLIRRLIAEPDEVLAEAAAPLADG